MSVVSIIKRGARSVETAVREAVELAGGLDHVVTERSRVLVKPNLVTARASGSGVVTDCRVTAAVAKLVLEQEPARVVIAEGAGYGYDAVGARGDTLDAFERSGTRDVAERLGVAYVDLNRDAAMEVAVPDSLVMDRVKIAKTAVECDVRISVPVLKTHRRTIVTLSLKNMKGVMPSREKRKTHQLGLEQAIVDLNKVVKPDFTVVDGLVGVGGLWEGEDTEQMNLVVAGPDPVAVDAVGAAIMGFDPSRIRTLQLAAEAGLGTLDVAAIETRGARIEDVAKRFLDPQRAFAQRYPGVTLLDDQSCTACEGELQSPLFYIREAGCAEQLAGLTVLMGVQRKPPPESARMVVMGRCVHEFKDRGVYVPGCPPRGWALTEAICDACDIEKDPVIAAIEKIHGSLHEIR